MKPAFPKELSWEFLLVDLVNNLDRLAEAKEEVLAQVKTRALTYDVSTLRDAARLYGTVKARKFFARALREDMSHIT